jgi:hypothetical protein
MKILRTAGLQKCEHDVNCQKMAEFVRTVEPPTLLKENGLYCRDHAFDILIADQMQLAELVLDLVPPR